MVKVRKIKPSIKVAEEIEHLKQATGLNYIDTILEYCERQEIEVESIVSVVRNSPLLAKLTADAESLHFLAKSTKATLE
jgi:hypothetical protein